MTTNDQLNRIEKMLRAQLKGAGHLWWIGGYVYGVTSTGDPFIILYSSAEHLKEKVVRVYDRDRKKLPAYIPLIEGGDTEANPSKEQARKKGVYHECPPFEIVTFDGKDTQMGKERRFGDVLRLSRVAAEVGQALGQHSQSVAGQPPPPPPAESERPSSGQSPTRNIGPDDLPDYRYMALNADTTGKFDYAAYMSLKNDMYSDVDRITRTRESLVPAWSPGNLSNGAMLEALRTYCTQRQLAEGKGDDSSSAHQVAKKVAMLVYNREIKV
ncbi:MAG: hypothetical protein KC410_12725 [Anaerolineales bacterium]|uniref:hypothetical protein n=1 Tax=Promineifilum sp. TaxID=2664178 RepID=UPI001D550776|nr:hypothetical protein [Anaerolineales bacterium]MCO5182226.1 hypothetical protein [Promineifilum sp.]